jgi:hypothetical protein
MGRGIIIFFPDRPDAAIIKSDGDYVRKTF